MWKIVIVDDDRYVLQGMKNAIPWDELDAKCVGEAMDGVQGAQLIKDLNPHIIITDIYMPVMNGLDMIEKIRDEGFEGKVVILSGYADFEYARQALRLGVDDYLSKPLTVQTIKEVLQKVIKVIKKESIKQKENDKVLKNMMIYKSFAYNKWLQSLLMGTLQKESKEEVLDFFASEYISWEEGYHQVICIEVERNAAANNIAASEWGLFGFAMENIIQEIIENYNLNAEVTQIKFDHIAILAHFEQDAESKGANTNLVNFCNEVIKCIKDFLQLDIYIGIGDVKYNWTTISQSTEEAMEALGRKKLPTRIYKYGMHQDLEGEEIEETPLNIKYIRFYHRLTDTVKYGQSAEVIEMIDAFLDEHNNNSSVANYDVKFLANELWTIISYGLYEIGLLTSEIYSDQEIQKELALIPDTEGLKSWIAEKITGVFNDTKSNENIKHRQAVDFIIQYVEENYAEELTLNKLSEKVFISRNYLSDIFRNITGETFNNHLTRVRMRKARVLLMQGEYLIYEVAGMVGYKNVPYFSSLFKKHIGVNPSDIINKRLNSNS